MEAAIGMEIREHKSSFAVYVVLRVLVIAVAVLEFFNGNYETASSRPPSAFRWSTCSTVRTV